MLLFYGNELSHWLVENLTTRITRKRGLDGWARHHNGNVGRVFWRSLLGHTWLSIGLEIRRMVRGFIGILKLRLGSVNLKKMASEVSFIRNFRANHLGRNLRLGAEA